VCPPGCPLRGDLGDRPDEWLALWGQGTVRVRAWAELEQEIG
jgi:hypothetical protein